MAEIEKRRTSDLSLIAEWYDNLFFPLVDQREALLSNQDKRMLFVDLLRLIQERITNVGVPSATTRILSGEFQKVADTEFDYVVTSAFIYLIGGTQYTVPINTVFTLDPAVEDSRFDAVVLTTSNTIVVVEGEEADDPRTPSINQATQLLAGYVLVTTADSSIEQVDPTRMKRADNGNLVTAIRVDNELNALADLLGFTRAALISNLRSYFLAFGDVEVQEVVNPEDGLTYLQIIFTGDGSGPPYVPPANAGTTIFLSPTGNDSTGQRGNINKPYATLTAAKAVYQAGDTFDWAPGVYSGQVPLSTSGQDVKHHIPLGAEVNPAGDLINCTTSLTKVTITGRGKLSGPVKASSSSSINLEFGEGNFSEINIDFGAICVLRSPNPITNTGLWVCANGAKLDVYAPKFNYPSTTRTHFFAQFEEMNFHNCQVVHAFPIIVYASTLAFANTYYSKFNLLGTSSLDGPGLRTDSGPGDSNTFRGRIKLEGSAKINSTGDSIEIQKWEADSELVFDGAELNSGVGFNSIRATSTGNFQHRPVNIRIMYPGALVLDKVEILDVTRPITNLVAGTYPIRKNFTPGTPTAGPFSLILCSNVPGTGVGVTDNDYQPFANLAAFPATGEDDLLYLAEDTGLFYRWNGSAYVVVGGNTTSTTYRDFLETAVPAVPAADTARVYATDVNGITVLEYISSTGFIARIMRDSLFIARNESGATITKGTPVYLSGVFTGGGIVPAVSPARSNSLTTMPCIGLAAQDITNNGFGRILVEGRIDNLNTAAFTVGARLYVSSTAAGQLVSASPAPPNLDQRVAIVIRSNASSGSILVDVKTMLGELQGTINNAFLIGDGLAGNKRIVANNADGTKPEVRYNDTSNAWEFSNNGTAFNPIGTAPKCIVVAISDEITTLTAGVAKVTFRMPYAMTLTSVRASLTAAQTTGTILTIDINEEGASILSTKLTIDNTEKTSTTAATPAVISDASLADDAEITIDIDLAGTGAKGAKVYFIGV